MGSPQTYDPAPNVLRINDFSAGIIRPAQKLTNGANQPASFPPSTQPGSAASSFRCFYRQGVGLVPFPSYSSLMKTTAPAHSHAGGGPNVTGLFAAGPVALGSGLNNVSSDALFIAIEYTDNVFHLWRTVQRLYPLDGVNDATVLYETDTGLGQIPSGTAFAQTRVNFPGLGANVFGLIVVWNDETFNVSCSPDPANPATVDLKRITLPNILAVHTHESRIAAFRVQSTPFGTHPIAVPAFWQANDNIVISDPPESITFATPDEFFDVESAAGYGAWGSISSGELLLIRRTSGAILINGDLLAPSSAIKLPGIIGTGNIYQRGCNSPAGLLYVTENDGVYAWNGSNTSEKISSQIPDDAVLTLNYVSEGVGVFFDNMNNWVFFPNNWVYDCLTRSWWKCEDPLVRQFGAFTKSNRPSAIYATEVTPANGTQFDIWAFDMQQLPAANSWSWTSSPIQVSQGELVDLVYCEIVATNFTAAPATIKITPVAPSDSNGPGTALTSHNIAGNNPQSITFTIPFGYNAIRLGAPLGWTDYNIQFNVLATGDTSNGPAPILHEIDIGWSTSTRVASN